MKILKILVACFAVLVLSAFFVFELIFSRPVDNSLSVYAEENITSDSVEPLSGDDPDPSIIDYHWDLSGFDQYNLNLFTINPIKDGRFWVAYQSDLSDQLSALPDGDYYISYDVVATSVDPGFSVDNCFCWLQITTSETSGDGYYSSTTFTTLNQVKRSYLNFTKTSDIKLFLWGFGNHDGGAHGSSIFSNFMLLKRITSDNIDFTIPYQPNLKYIFTTSFTYGYRDGYDTGYDSGRNYGYNLGYISGYDTGYSYGRNSQISEGLFKNPLEVFLQPISNFLNTDIFGSFSIGDGFTIAFFVMIALIFIKMFAGG